MKENTTVVRGHFEPTAKQISQQNETNANLKVLRKLAFDAGYDEHSEADIAFEPWMIDDRWLSDEGYASWECLLLDTSKIYTALVTIPLSNIRCQVMFTVRTMARPRNEWRSEIDIHYVRVIPASDRDAATYDSSNNRDRPLAFQVERQWGELDITLNGELDVYHLEPVIANATVALCDMLQRRANVMGEVEACA